MVDSQAEDWRAKYAPERCAGLLALFGLPVRAVEEPWCRFATGYEINWFGLVRLTEEAAKVGCDLRRRPSGTLSRPLQPKDRYAKVSVWIRRYAKGSNSKRARLTVAGLLERLGFRYGGSRVVDWSRDFGVELADVRRFVDAFNFELFNYPKQPGRTTKEEKRKAKQRLSTQRVAQGNRRERYCRNCGRLLESNWFFCCEECRQEMEAFSEVDADFDGYKGSLRLSREKAF